MKYGSDLTDDDGAGIDLLAAVNLHPPPLGVAVSSIPGASLPLLVCHNALRLNGYFFDPHTRQLLAVSGLFAIAFPLLHLKNDEFGGLGERDDLARYLCAFHYRSSDVKLTFFLNHQNLVENNGIALIAVDLFYGNHVSLGDLVLLTACFDHCIHGSYPSENFLTLEHTENGYRLSIEFITRRRKKPGCCANTSSFVIAAYAKVLLMNGDGFQIRPRARLACSLFTTPSHFHDF
jgi:hypothetical protein